MPEKYSKQGSFQTQPPRIPGVPGRSSAPPARPAAPGPAKNTSHSSRTVLGICVVVGALIAVSGLAWRAAHGKRAATAWQQTLGVMRAVVKKEAKVPVGPGNIATTDELAEPWSSKLFSFHNSLTEVTVPALLVHLSGDNYWAFSLIEPYGDCRLQYVTDLNQLKDEYQVTVDHPMVVDPCNKAVFDLTRYGNGPTGLVRGDVIRGSALRPPVAIEIRVEGKRIVAGRIE